MHRQGTQCGTQASAGALAGAEAAAAAAAAASGAVKDVPPDSDAEPSGASDSEASMSDDDELREAR